MGCHCASGDGVSASFERGGEGKRGRREPYFVLLLALGVSDVEEREKKRGGESKEQGNISYVDLTSNYDSATLMSRTHDEAQHRFTITRRDLKGEGGCQGVGYTKLTRHGAGSADLPKNFQGSSLDIIPTFFHPSLRDPQTLQSCSSASTYEW